MAVKRGLFVAPFGELSDPRLLADLAADAEASGWDGFFLWDHIRYSPPSLPVSDPWVALSAIAMSTTRLRIGPLVTPIARRRPHKLARETVTLDRLSNGRLTLGVGLGSDNHGELGPFGEVEEPKERARLLDDGLDQLANYWREGFEPPPVQQPRIPIWVAGRWPSKAPLRRAARWDGFFPIDLPGPEALTEVKPHLSSSSELVVTNPPGTPTDEWEGAGATWCLTGFGKEPKEEEVRDQAQAGP